MEQEKKAEQREVSYVFQLPARIVCEISNALDPGNCWEEMAFIMPGIRDMDIEACRRLVSLGDHPTEKYSSGRVDKQFHHFVKVCADESTHSSPQQQQTHNSQRPSTNDKPHHKNSAMIYSRKGASSVNASGVPGPSGEPYAVGTALSGTSSATSADKATDALISGLQNTPAVTYEDLATATGGFSSNKIIGRGGYGVVYRGLWKHTQVAIKRIQGKSGGDERVRQHPRKN
uniref:Protein kinase domain-containing protein n=1 Tax=Globodera pallida TaxID=36090 RepID=A0A183CHQ2_GLOPA